MADNITIKDGAGVSQVVAADDILGILYPRQKISIGGADVAVDVSKDTPLPVTPGILKTTHFSEVAINASASGDNSLVGATASQITRVYGFFLMNMGGVAVNIKFRDGTTDLHPAITIVPTGTWTLPRDGAPWFTITVNTILNLNLSAAGSVVGRMYYVKS